MRTINPIAKIWANAEREQVSKDIRKGKRLKGIREYMFKYHTFERTLSGKKTGELKYMLGKTAKKLNDRLFQKYIKDSENKVDGKSLERWVFSKNANK